MHRPRFRLLAAFLLGAVATYVGAEVSRAFWAWNDSPRSVSAFVASTIVSWLIIGLGGTVAALLVAVAAWLATGVFGVPATITAATARDIESYKWFAAKQHLLLSAPYPRINTSVAAPILPGVVLIFHGVQLAGQAGGGGWELYLWFGLRPRPVHHWTRWYS